MNRLLTVPLLMALVAACQTTRRPPDRVDPALLQHVDDRGRQNIAEARRVRDEAIDAIAAARRSVEQARAEVDIAREEKAVAEAKVSKAMTEAKARRHEAGQGNGDGNGDSLDAGIVAARAELAAAEDRIDWREEVVNAAEAEVALAKARLELAEAKVTFAEARALRDSERPEAERLDMLAIERNVGRKQTEVDVAQVRRDAAVREADLARSRAEESFEERKDRVRRSSLRGERSDHQ